MPATATAVKIAGIPVDSPFSVFNGRTGHVVGPGRFGLVQVRLTFVITADEVVLAFGPDGTVADFTDDSSGHDVYTLGKFLVDAPIVEPGRLEEDMDDLALAARSEVRRMARKVRGEGTGSELWQMVAERGQALAYFANLIPESVATPEDAIAWVHEHAARECFGF
jgi:hypothetical protein